MNIEPGDDLGVFWRCRPLGWCVYTSSIVPTEGIQLHIVLTPPPEACAMLRNYTNYRVMILLTLNFGEVGPRAHFSGGPNSSTPKSQNHSEIRDFSDTVQGLGLVLVRNDQPFDLPCPYG